MQKLNLGCGEEKKAGYVNVDWQASVSPDVVHDLNRVPNPFNDASFDLIEAFHVLEHLDRPFAIMGELHRILKPGGVLHLKVPHFSRGFTHAEHCHGFDVSFPYYFNPAFTKSGYFGVNFELERMTLRWMVAFPLLVRIGYGNLIIGILRVLNAAVTFLANAQQAFCSRLWCYWVGGFEEIEFIFICRK